MAMTQQKVFLTISQRSELKSLIEDKQLTAALDLLRGVASNEATNNQLLDYLRWWQRLLVINGSTNYEASATREASLDGE